MAILPACWPRVLYLVSSASSLICIKLLLEDVHKTQPQTLAAWPLRKGREKNGKKDINDNKTAKCERGVIH